MDFKKELDQRTAYIETILCSYLPKEEGGQKLIMEAVNYSLLAGGKRLRPMLMLEAYRLFGGNEEETVKPFMAAIEMIHTYSLVHDDLPAMDNDAYRRGKKTTHVVYGEAMGILAGDALLNFAFETALKSFENGINLEGKAEALAVLAGKAGIYGMIGGQVIDILENESTDFSTTQTIYKLKTSALIEASMMIGAILAGAKRDEVKRVEAAAGSIGLAFQIQDDILDVTSSDTVLGKPVHSDEKNRKATYVTIKGLEKSKEDVKKYSKAALEALLGTGRENDFLKELVVYLMERKK